MGAPTSGGAVAGDAGRRGDGTTGRGSSVLDDDCAGACSSLGNVVVEEEGAVGAAVGTVTGDDTAMMRSTNLLYESEPITAA